MAALQTNVIRVYAVDPTLDHTVCMNLLQQYGMYVVSDLSEPGISINRDTPSWNDQLYQRYTSVIDMFSNYTNVIGFFAGNEVSNALNNTQASAFVKAAVRDMKAYIAAKNYRQMYVGYATSDDANIRENMANYFNCGNQAEAIDFWGYNIYSWCGDSSYTQSGYDQRVAEFSSYSVPSFFAEYGCNTPSPRQFTEVQALYGSNMTAVFSGGIVYMYFEEENNFGKPMDLHEPVLYPNINRSCGYQQWITFAPSRLYCIVHPNGFSNSKRRQHEQLLTHKLSASLSGCCNRNLGIESYSTASNSKQRSLQLHVQLAILCDQRYCSTNSLWQPIRDSMRLWRRRFMRWYRR
jgi:hypothetical protein